jgi:hypothetical protein
MLYTDQRTQSYAVSTQRAQESLLQTLR